ncbi:hypothetical protein [Streptomyces sp. NRRL F-5527]|uniref:hypothetical protein n=1 Tax=Streptomyces sp. NRRL F-5527 TaxID=1463862 RepID=UPI001F262274|nr:hypothetical protein [Streptomyces sp. NRRL F-5527]
MIVRRTVISEHLLPLREQMAALDSGSGLYAALGSLPPRQFDVMVLRYIGHYDAKRSSWYMGITPQHRRLPLPQGPGAPVPAPLSHASASGTMWSMSSPDADVTHVES